MKSTKSKKQEYIETDAEIDEMLANEEPFTDEQMEELFGLPQYDGWELVVLGGGGYTVHCKIAFHIPWDEEDWVYKYLFNNPSHLIPLTLFVRHAPQAFKDILCLEANGFRVQDLRPVDRKSWAIHAKGQVVEEALQQMIEDGDEPDPTEESMDLMETVPVNNNATSRERDKEAALTYLRLANYDGVNHPMPDCMTADIRQLPRQRFARSLAELCESISPFNNKKQRFTYWMLFLYEHSS